jgi:hypothetical protein
MDKTKYLNQEWRSYKPKKDYAGAASKVQVKIVPVKFTAADEERIRFKVQAFWVATNQLPQNDKNGNATFGWGDESKFVTLKLGEVDIGELLAVINGKKQIAGSESGKYKGIYHQHAKGSTSFTFQYNEQYKNYYVRLAKKIGDKVTEVKHSITLGEAEVLKVLLEKTILAMYQFIM